jgi:tetratricopeptide (TPR) repeat protein
MLIKIVPLIVLIVAAACGAPEVKQDAEKSASVSLDRSLLDRHPDSPVIISPKGETEEEFVERMKHLTRQEPVFQKDDYERLVNEGLTRYKLNEFIEAIKLFTNAIEADASQPEAFYYRGQVFIEIRNFAAAKNDFLKVSTITSDDHEVWNFLGVCQSQEGDEQAAVESFNEAIRLNSANAMYYYNRGSSLAKIDRLNEAFEDFDTAIRMGSDRSGIYNNRANVRYLLGDYRGAISDYTLALQRDPNTSAPYANRAFARMFTGDTLRACIDWRTAHEMGHPTAKGFMQLYCKGIDLD